jgi:hypothetical protein
MRHDLAQAAGIVAAADVAGGGVNTTRNAPPALGAKENALNIDDLTIKQARELAALFSASQLPAATQPPNIASGLIGKYVIARCYAAGVHAGTVAAVDGENVILHDSRRLWSWQAKDGIALSGVAQHGIKDKGCKVDVVNPVLYLTGVCELIPATSAAMESINAYK